MVGMPSIPKHVDWTAIWHKELVVRGAYVSDPEIFSRSLEILQQPSPALRGLVGAKFPLQRYKEAIACALHTGATGVVKTAFEP